MEAGMCSSGKKEFNSASAAMNALSKMPKEMRDQRSYRCPLCSMWHLTSQNQDNGKSFVRRRLKWRK